eukprot:365394-Chlamydomonas_euryale.AAC.2
MHVRHRGRQGAHRGQVSRARGRRGARWAERRCFRCRACCDVPGQGGGHAVSHARGGMEGDKQGGAAREGGMDGEKQGGAAHEGGMDGEKQGGAAREGGMDGEKQGGAAREGGMDGEKQGGAAREGGTDGEKQGGAAREGGMDGDKEGGTGAAEARMARSRARCHACVQCRKGEQAAAPSPQRKPSQTAHACAARAKAARLQALLTSSAWVTSGAFFASGLGSWGRAGRAHAAQRMSATRRVAAIARQRRNNKGLALLRAGHPDRGSSSAPRLTC